MPERNLPAEVADVDAWFATHPLVTKPSVSIEAGHHRNTLPQALSTGKATADLLDSVYPTLAAYGYQPLSTDYLFL